MNANTHLATGLVCRYRNTNAGHDLRVKVVAAIHGRLWTVQVLDQHNGSRFPKGERLTVHEHDLGK